MALSERDVRYVAELARLELTDEEIAKFLPQLDSILEHVQRLSEVPTDDVEPMAQVMVAGARDVPLRGDEAQPTFAQTEALANAPEPSAQFFKVPRVIERE